LIRAGGRTGEFVLGLRSSEDAVLRKHLHRGVVTAVTLCGEWDYLERSWIARPGDYVRENSGAIKRMIQKKHYNKALYC
jgi:2,4'-dihydroxyacetophenone dioxygenase